MRAASSVCSANIRPELSGVDDGALVNFLSSVSPP
jgi:hypothetical protein